MKIIMKQFTLALAALSLGIVTGYCGSAKITGESEISATPTNKPTVVYIADFDLDAADIKAEKGVLPPPPKLPGLLGNALPPPPGAPQDPQKLARRLVDEMSEALVKELTKAGFTARRLTSTNNLPTSGWLVRGVFTEVNQGNQLRRAVIGFGAGKTDLQVIADIADLSRGAPKDFYKVTTAANSGRLPGTAPMIAVHPAAVAVRFVIAAKDLDRDVKQTAKKIAGEVVRQSAPQTSQRPRTAKLTGSTSLQSPMTVTQWPFTSLQSPRTALQSPFTLVQLLLTPMQSAFTGQQSTLTAEQSGITSLQRTLTSKQSPLTSLQSSVTCRNCHLHRNNERKPACDDHVYNGNNCQQ